ncbi:TlpA family protein disulfide reductase [Polaribacter uvawellassae]|uniref:TlpA family protein disulfide reductase n=1 Tax=Polaribacter uvawellassae TaxID=3133495 RepID=UPI00321934B2
MKILITSLFLLISFNSYCQTEYFTTDGKNRITKAEAKERLTKQVDKMTKILGKQLYGSLTVEETITKKDSIISKITFAISDKKKNDLLNTGPLSEFKDKAFPKFDLNTLTEENFDSENLKGKPTMINFWFTRCAPCIDEMPILNKIKEKYKDDFNFIAITYEKEEDVKKFLKKHPFNFEHLINAENFTDQLGITAYPMNLFLDKNGVLKYVKGGIPYVKLEGEELKMGEGNEIIEILEKLK